MAKYEKITLWAAVQTYGAEYIGALDYILPALDNLAGECQILDYDSEEYKLVKVRKTERRS